MQTQAKFSWNEMSHLQYQSLWPRRFTIFCTTSYTPTCILKCENKISNLSDMTVWFLVCGLIVCLCACVCLQTDSQTRRSNVLTLGMQVPVKMIPQHAVRAENTKLLLPHLNQHVFPKLSTEYVTDEKIWWKSWTFLTALTKVIHKHKAYASINVF